ncbi:MAG: helix-turn-helix domain-containing protein [Zoogloeaceae bacterium]|jgi:DNA-binding transcriptional ArsR family regulator|nr:helix-turn-helix domain-containing protein [Zoogloeaceae bacterium]
MQTSTEIISTLGAFDLRLLLTLLVMLIAGAFGGLVNHTLAERQTGEANLPPNPPTPEAARRALIRALVLGVLTALTAPLVLAVLSSPLLDNMAARPAHLYVFAAFCLVYVLAMQRIFGNPVEARKLRQLQQELRQLREQQTAWRQYLEPLLLAVEEKQNAPREALTYSDVEILRALADESYVYGNLAALTEKTTLGRELISQRLTVLKNMGLIDTRITDKNILHWVISSRGRQSLADLQAGLLEGEKNPAVREAQNGGKKVA